MYVHLQITMVRLKLPETDIVMVTETLLFSIQSDVHELQRWYHNTYSDFPLMSTRYRLLSFYPTFYFLTKQRIENQVNKYIAGMNHDIASS